VSAYQFEWLSSACRFFAEVFRKQASRFGCTVPYSLEKVYGDVVLIIADGCSDGI
jgi:hypothetical protein